MEKPDFLNKMLSKLSIFSILVITFITSFLMLFLPNNYLKKLKLLNFIENMGYIFGLLFIISFSGLIHIFVIKKYNKFKKIKEFNKLTFDEKEILGKYINLETKTKEFNFNNGVVNGLLKKGILYIPNPHNIIPDEVPYNIQEWAWEYLNENEELIEITKEEKEKRKEIRNKYINNRF